MRTFKKSTRNSWTNAEIAILMNTVNPELKLSSELNVKHIARGQDFKLLATKVKHTPNACFAYLRNNWVNSPRKFDQAVKTVRLKKKSGNFRSVVTNVWSTEQVNRLMLFINPELTPYSLFSFKGMQQNSYFVNADVAGRTASACKAYVGKHFLKNEPLFNEVVDRIVAAQVQMIEIPEPEVKDIVVPVNADSTDPINIKVGRVNITITYDMIAAA